MSEIQAYHCTGDEGGQPLHCHEEVEFIAVYRGRGSFQSGRSCHATGPGVFTVVCPMEPHSGSPADADFSVKALYVAAAWFAAAELDWRFLWRKGSVCETPSALSPFTRLFDTVWRNHSRCLQEEALLTLYHSLRGAAPFSPVSEPKRISQAISLLRERFTDDISLTELAASVGLNPDYLCRAFTKKVGLPPHAYQICLRVARAKTLLEKGTPPAEAAVEVGFYDQSHLNLHFKRLLGIRPAQIMKRSISSYPALSSEK